MTSTKQGLWGLLAAGALTIGFVLACGTGASRDFSDPSSGGEAGRYEHLPNPAGPEELGDTFESADPNAALHAQQADAYASAASGGAASDGAASGGTASGGAASGGAASGGAASGGAASGETSATAGDFSAEANAPGANDTEELGDRFESANPNAPVHAQEADAYVSAGTGGVTGTSWGCSAEADALGAEDAAERAIEEADIIQIENGRLYAMSGTGGPSVVDVSVRDRLTLLGNYRMGAQPFEMYVRDGVVLGLFTGWGKYAYDAAIDRYE